MATEHLVVSTPDALIAVSGPEQLAAVVRGAARSGERRRVALVLDAGPGHRGAVDWVAFCARARDAERCGHVDVVGVQGRVAEEGSTLDRRHRAAVARFTTAVRVARGLGLQPIDLHLHVGAADASSPPA